MAKFNQVICFSVVTLGKKWPPANEAHLKNLIERCKNDEKAAWDELFERFVGLILQTINRTLKKYNRTDLVKDPDVFQQIVLKITRVLKTDRTLDKLRHALALPHLIKLNARYRTIEWLREQTRQKVVFIREMERSQLSLEAPLGSGENPGTLKDIVENEEPMLENPDLETPRKLRDVLAQIAAMDQDERLLMRSLFIYYESLRDTDIQEIARRRKITEEKVTREISGLLATLADKAFEREDRRGRETVLWHELRKLESKVKDIALDPLKADKLEETEQQIQEIEKKLELLRGKNRGAVRPTNREIAQLLGMKEEEARTISQKIFKIRKKLADAVKKKEAP